LLWYTLYTMEKQPHQEYRDELADKLKEIRNSDPENPEFAKAKAEGYLDAKKETREYEESRDRKLDSFLKRESKEALKKFIEEIKLTGIQIDWDTIYEIMRKDETKSEDPSEESEKIIKKNPRFENVILPGNEFPYLMVDPDFQDKVLSSLEPNTLYFFPCATESFGVAFGFMGGGVSWEFYKIAVDSKGEASAGFWNSLINNYKDKTVKILAYDKKCPLTYGQAVRLSLGNYLAGRDTYFKGEMKKKS
jgi:hypothetical protein